MISYADQAALIDDPRVLRIAITDNREPLADLRSIPALAVDHARTDVQQLSDNPFQVRAAVAGRLSRGQASLPGGYQLQIKEGWHWSYGDCYWAFQAGHDTACYGPL